VKIKKSGKKTLRLVASKTPLAKTKKKFKKLFANMRESSEYQEQSG
jgi:hypothetical protein